MTGEKLGDSNSLWPHVEDEFLEHHLPGQGRAVAALRNAVAGINSSYNPNLITAVSISGETGAGKNHLARVIAGHRFWLASGGAMRADLPLGTFTSKFDEIAVPSLTDTLVESELFGHVKGAFTGADREKQGLLAGNVDDILLDEIGDASSTVQAKLLAVLESRRFRKVGSIKEEETSARMLFATNHDLAALVRESTFREDLFWRATAFTIHVPSLRDQLENVGRMVRYQLRELWPLAMMDPDTDQGLRPRIEPTPADLRWASSYNWPGNLRQLRHTLMRWLALSGQVSLREVALMAETQLSTPASAAGTGMGPLEGLTTRLDKARAEGAPIAPNLDALLAEASREFERHFVSWYGRARLDNKELSTLFPGMKPESVRSKVSTWKNKQ